MYLRVALDAPLRRCFDYSPPRESCGERLPPGIRVKVPFGRGSRIGILIDTVREPGVDPARIRPVTAILDDEPVLPPRTLALIKWAAGYYHHPLGEAIMTALPALLRTGRGLDPTAPAAATTATRRAPLRLNAAQAAAMHKVLAAAGRFCPFLLDGVTGSGKTEIYLQTAAAAITSGRQALILVPEIGLSGALLTRLRERFPGNIAVLHSALTERERLRAWSDARSGRSDLVIGTRSAVWTPLPRPGLIVVDEEHDLSYKQQDGFRYSARDVAVARARIEGVPILLGSATPSLESIANVRSGRYRSLRLPQRAGRACMPAINVIDLRQRRLHGALAAPLIEAIGDRIAKGEQALVFLNRRGYAPVMLCHDCGTSRRCRRCEVNLVYHRDRQRLVCHHCGGEQPMTPICRECGSERMIAVGHGTERVVDVLQARFPEARILRIDRDTTRRKGALDDALSAARSGEAQILVGTQMLSKGHHFPSVTLAAIIDADSRLHSADFRAAERLAQGILQVAGRAGRGDRPGEVFIQTHHPDHPLLRTLIRHDYAVIGDALLQERRATDLPPYAHLALLRAEATAAAAPERFLSTARDGAAPISGSEVQMFGPIPAPMPRRIGRYRAQLLVQSRQRRALHRLLDDWLPLIEVMAEARAVRWSLDVDPQEMI